MLGYEFRTEPFERQRAEFELTAEKEVWAYFWEQGTGKTKMIIDTAAHMFDRGEIDAVLVVAPPSVYTNWTEDEIPLHLPEWALERSLVHPYKTASAATRWHQRALGALIAHDGLAWACMSYNAFMTKRGKKFAWDFLRHRRCLYVLDESWYIKTPSAKRTLSIVASGQYARYKRVLNGTPVANSPFDVYKQVEFLDEKFWKRRAIGSALAFRHTFGVLKKFQDANERERTIAVGYQHLDVLREWLGEISSRVLKQDVVDLPPKMFSKRYFDLSPEQARVYGEMRDHYMVELESGELASAPIVLSRLLRFAQITRGYLPTDDGPVHRFDPNPALGVVEDYVDGCSGQAILWAERDMEIDDLLRVVGDRGVRLDGKVAAGEAREAAKRAFKSGDRQFLVAKPSVGGSGLTLNEAGSVLYYSNSFNLLQRQQSEDRAHRIGQDKPVTYTDVVASGTVDSHIVSSLRRKYNIASEVTGDEVAAWL